MRTRFLNPYKIVARYLSISLLMAVLVFALSGCGGASGSTGSGGPQNVTLTLDWYPNADHAGIYAAQEQGYFKRAGLKVNIQQPSDPASVLQLVAAGRSEFGVSYENEMTSAGTKGIPVESVMAIMQEPLNSIISLKKSHITSPEDLVGKKVGYSGQDFGTAVIDTVLRKAGKDPSSVQKINVGYDLRSALISGKVDAVVDGYWNIEAVELARKGFETNVIRLPKVGVPNYNELVIATSDSYAKEHPDVVRRFVGALVKGHEYAIKHPKSARDALLKANRQLNPKVVDETLKLTVPVFEAKGKPVGYQEPGEWRDFVDWEAKNGVIPKKVSVGKIMTNEYLPKR